jgi:hypothetical protein
MQKVTLDNIRSFLDVKEIPSLRYFIGARPVISFSIKTSGYIVGLVSNNTCLVSYYDIGDLNLTKTFSHFDDFQDFIISKIIPCK